MSHSSCWWLYLLCSCAPTLVGWSYRLLLFTMYVPCAPPISFLRNHNSDCCCHCLVSHCKCILLFQNDVVVAVVFVIIWNEDASFHAIEPNVVAQSSGCSIISPCFSSLIAHDDIICTCTAVQPLQPIAILVCQSLKSHITPYPILFLVPDAVTVSAQRLLGRWCTPCPIAPYVHYSLSPENIIIGMSNFC